jgi:DNA-binding CsgD family transcriptional regulator
MKVGLLCRAVLSSILSIEGTSVHSKNIYLSIPAFLRLSQPGLIDRLRCRILPAWPGGGTQNCTTTFSAQKIKITSLSSFASSQSSKWGLAFNRSKSDFSEEERKMAQLIRPHLAQAHHNSQIYSDLSEALESDGRGFLVVDLNGKIRCATSNAKRYLERYAGPIKSQMLPNPVRDWVRVQSDRFAVPEFTLQNVLRLHRENGRLTIQVLTVTADGETRLSLTEETSPLAASSLEGLGLTKREAEVLFWVTQGKRNSEIGLILGTKERTIYKHLERVFAKLNVETRTAAANIVFERFHKSAVCRSR